MSVDVVMCFGVQARRHRAAVAKAVRSVPGIAGGLLEGCDVGVRTPARTLLLRIHLAEGPDAPSVVAELASRSARAHGFAVALRGELAAAADAVADALQGSDALEVSVGGPELDRFLDRVLGALWPRRRGGARPSHDHAPRASPPAGRPASRRPTRPSADALLRWRSPPTTS